MAFEIDNNICECLECCKPLIVAHPRQNMKIKCVHCGAEFRVRRCWELENMNTETINAFKITVQDIHMDTKKLME